MPTDKTAINTLPAPESTATPGPTHAIGDTLTVVSGRISGEWVVEDESGTVYRLTAVE